LDVAHSNFFTILALNSRCRVSENLRPKKEREWKTEKPFLAGETTAYQGFPLDLVRCDWARTAASSADDGFGTVRLVGGEQPRAGAPHTPRLGCGRPRGASMVSRPIGAAGAAWSHLPMWCHRGAGGSGMPQRRGQRTFLLRPWAPARDIGASVAALPPPPSCPGLPPPPSRLGDGDPPTPRRARLLAWPVGVQHKRAGEEEPGRPLDWSAGSFVGGRCCYLVAARVHFSPARRVLVGPPCCSHPPIGALASTSPGR
jgi:hypothetical protein